jgi:hypothetical protein
MFKLVLLTFRYETTRCLPRNYIVSHAQYPDSAQWPGPTAFIRAGLFHSAFVEAAINKSVTEEAFINWLVAAMINKQELPKNYRNLLKHQLRVYISRHTGDANYFGRKRTMIMPSW